MQDFFHIHTWRCKHGSDESDETIIQKAISLGAKKSPLQIMFHFPKILLEIEWIMRNWSNILKH